MIFHSIEEMIAASAGGIRPPERLTVAEAAERYRYLNNPGSYVGYWDNTVAPYLVEPMEVLTSLDYIGMIFVGPARTGSAVSLPTSVRCVVPCTPTLIAARIDTTVPVHEPEMT